MVSGEEQGKELRKRFNVRGNPTVMLVNSVGEEIDRIIGFNKDGDAFVQTVKDYAAGKGVLFALLKQYQNDSLDVKNNFVLAKKYTNRMEYDKSVTYYGNVFKLDPNDQEGFREESTLRIAIFEMWKDKNSTQLEVFLKNTNEKEFLSDGYSELIYYYESQKDTVKFYEAFENAVAVLPQNAQLMNRYAWAIYENKNKAKYDRGIELARLALEREPESSGIWDTLAWLLFEKGDKEGAVKAMEKAAEFTPEYKEGLKKMLELV